MTGSAASSNRRRTLLYTMPTVVSAVLPLITLPIFSSVLTPADYGVNALAAAYGAFGAMVANLGLPVVYERNFFQYAEPGAAARLLYSIVVFVTILLVALGAGTWFFQGALSQAITGSSAHGHILFVSYCSFALQSVKFYFLTYFKNSGDVRSFVLYSVDETILWTAAALILVVGLDSGPIGVPLGQLVGGFLVCSVLAARFVRTLRPAFDRVHLGESIAFALPLTPRLFTSTMSNNLDKYLIGVLGSIGGVGIYSIGQKVALLVFSVMTAIQNVYAPGVYKRLFAGGDEAAGVGRYLTPFAYASVGVALLTAMFAEEALFFLTPPEYHGAALVVNILAMYYAVLFFGKQPQLIFAKKAVLVSVVSAMTVGLSVVFTVAGVRSWGVIGAALGTMVAGVLSTAIGTAVGQRYAPIRYETRKLAVMYAALAVACSVVFTVSLAAVPYVARLALKLTAVGAFIEIGRRQGHLGFGTIQAIRRVVGRRVCPGTASQVG